MKFSPKKINHAGVIVPAFLLLIGVLCFVGTAWWGFPITVFQLISLLCFAIGILILSRYGLCNWEYALTEETEEYPYGRLQVVKRNGARLVPYADLDLSFAVLMLSAEERKAQAKEKTLPPYQKTVSVVKNMFAKDVYDLFIGFRAGNARLILELNDEAFYYALQARVERAIADDARNKKLQQLDEEPDADEAYDDIEEEVADLLDASAEQETSDATEPTDIQE